MGISCEHTYHRHPAAADLATFRRRIPGRRNPNPFQHPSLPDGRPDGGAHARELRLGLPDYGVVSK